MNLLFWNINKKSPLKEIKILCDSYDVDILVLAENELKDEDILYYLNEDFIAPNNYNLPKISFYTRIHKFQIVDDNPFWGSIRKITHPSGIEILLVAVHLPSKCYKDESEQSFIAIEVAQEIDKREQEQNHTHTLVMGDFNMNPFEKGMISSAGFHSVMDKKIAAKLSRKVQGKERKYFYNPMWSRLGDDSEGQPGTYYHQAKMNEYFWHTFDQVLLRPSLLNWFNSNNLKVIDEINGVSLIQNGKIKNSFSDHLPLFIKLDVKPIKGDK